jgi:hypothetical protein
MHQLNLHVDRPNGLPEEAYRLMGDEAAKLRRSEEAAARKYETALQQLQKEHAEAVHGIIIHSLDRKGNKGRIDEFLEFQRQHRARLHAAREKVRAGQSNQKEFAEARRQLVHESTAHLTRAAIDIGAVRRVHREIQQKIEAAFMATLGEGHVAKEARVPVKNQTFTPPFSGSLESLSIHWAKGDSSDDLPNPSNSTFLSRQLGKLGNTSAISVSDASDYDQAEVFCKTALLQWFQMPANGEVRVRFKGEIVEADRSGSVENEFGWSSVDVAQRVRFYAQVISPSLTPKAWWPAQVWEGGPASAGAIGWVYDDHNEDDHSLSWSGPSPGLPIAGSNLVVPEVFAKGVWVLAKVGVAHRNRFVSNDCGVISNQKSKFMIKEIGLSSTG